MSPHAWYHRVLDGYRVGGHIGGALGGELYEAQQLADGRLVALKLVSVSVAAAPGFQARFERDVARLGSFEHPHVARLLGARHADSVTYLATDPLEGPTLAELIAASVALDPARASELVAQLAAGLDAAHEHGLVHRGLSPASIVVRDEDGLEHAAITDFAVADDTELYGGLSGRPSETAQPPIAYASPEQVRGGPVDARTDVYALGAILFHALTGRPPYAGLSSRATLRAHLFGELPSAAALVRDLPDGFDAVLSRALAKDPSDRYATASQLVRALPSRHRLLPGRRSRPAAVADDVVLDDVAFDDDVLDDDELADLEQDLGPEAGAPTDRPPQLDPIDVPARPARTGRGRRRRRRTRRALIGAGVLLLAAIASVLVAAGAFDGSDDRGRTSRAGAVTATTSADSAAAALAALRKGGSPPPPPPAPKTDVAGVGTTPAAPPAPAATSTTLTWPAGRSAYTAVVYVSETDRATAIEQARRAAKLGVPAGVLRSDDYANLAPGAWVAFAGVSDTEAQAQHTADLLREAGVAAAPYTRFVKSP